MIRFAYIYNQVLQIYKSMKQIEFPIEPCQIISGVQNCREMTYQAFAEMNHCSIEDVILLCESKSGCTHYDIAKDRYLILWNRDGANHNVPGRRRWTKAHELGHVVLRHLPLSTSPLLSENSFSNLTAPNWEMEADQFASTLLCPIPLFSILQIQSPVDIGYVFGLSTEASNYKWNEYNKWLHSHRKTAFEADMRNLFLDRQTQGRTKIPPLRSFNSEFSHGAISIWKDENELI